MSNFDISTPSPLFNVVASQVKVSTKRITTLNRGRGGAGYRQKRCFLKLRKDADRKRLFCPNVSTLLSMIVGADIFELNSNSYLIVVDHCSKYPELCILKDKTASSVVTSMKSIFARHGIPDEVVADNMPFSSNAFRKFASARGFEVSTSSPRYPQSNGMSERAIQTIKNVLKKACEDGNDPYIALLEYRNTPISGLKESPAQLLMSRMLKSKLPTVESVLKPRVVDNPQQKLQQRSDKQKMYYDRNAKPIPSIKEGEAARVRKGKTWEPAIVTAQHTAPRSYIVKTPDGTAYRRNRRHLLPTVEPMMGQPHPQYCPIRHWLLHHLIVPA